jgi:MFS superfamily sulfate permease-like transporter
VNLGASLANHRAGGRSRLAAVAAAAVLLGAVLLLGPVIAMLPRVVIAGMLFVVGVQLFDQWSLKLLVRTVRGKLIHGRRMALDLLVVLLVAASILVLDPVGAGWAWASGPVLPYPMSGPWRRCTTATPCGREGA